MEYLVLRGGGILSLRGGPIIVQGGASKILRAFGALMIRPPPVKEACYAPGRGLIKLVKNITRSYTLTLCGFIQSVTIALAGRNFAIFMILQTIVLLFITEEGMTKNTNFFDVFHDNQFKPHKDSTCYSGRKIRC